MLQSSLRNTFKQGALALAIFGLVSACSSTNGGLMEQGKSLLGGAMGSGSAGALTNTDIASGLKEALRVGTERVVGQLGQADGFNNDPSVHIPLPDQLKTVQSALSKVGLSSMVDDLEVKLNRAAETATPKAKKLFWQSITEMKLEDVEAIYKGEKDAATQYFRGKMSEPLAAEMGPVVDSSLAQVGAVQSYDNVMGKYKKLPFVPDAKADLKDYVIEKGMDGMFFYLAKEEAAIRENPAKQTTAILKRVFGAN